MARNLILCIDDDPDLLHLHTIVLERAGYSVVAASAATQAMEVFREKPVDLVITDHILPGRSGSELIAEMKRMKPTVPIIMLSGLPEAPEGEQHADVFVEKIGGTQALLRTVASTLTRYKQPDKTQ